MCHSHDDEDNNDEDDDEDDEEDEDDEDDDYDYYDEDDDYDVFVFVFYCPQLLYQQDQINIQNVKSIYTRKQRQETKKCDIESTSKIIVMTSTYY